MMTPEELEEARYYATHYQDGYVKDLILNLLDHIEQQARERREAEAQIAKLENQLAEYRKPMKSMDTAQLSEWSRKLAELLSAPDDERAYIPWQIAVGDHLEKFVQSWHSARITELEADLEKEEHNSEAFMNKIGEQVCYIVDLENQVADLEKRNEDLTHRLGKEQVVAMQDRETQLQKYIRELEARVKALKEIAENERAAVLTADICDGCDSYGDMSMSGRAALRGEPTRVDDFEGREERIAMARRQLAKEHPEIDWRK